MYLLRLLRRGRLTGADGPDGLVGNNPSRQGRDTLGRDDRVQLAGNHRLGYALLTLSEGLPHAKDRLEARGARHGELGRHHGIVFTIKRTALRMADDDVGATKIQQHGCRDLAREGTGKLVRQILPAPSRGRAGQLRLDLGYVKVGWADRHLALGNSRQARLDPRQQLTHAHGGTIHFPVAGNQGLTHENLLPFKSARR